MKKLTFFLLLVGLLAYGFTVNKPPLTLGKSGDTFNWGKLITTENMYGIGTYKDSLFIDNGTVTGVNATSSTVSFNLKGLAGSNDIFSVASSSGTVVFKITSTGTASLLHLIGNSSLPTIATSTGLGTAGCTAVFCQAGRTGTDLAGFITAGTGTTPAANATIVTLTFTTPYASPPYCTITNASTTTATVWATTTSSTLVLKSSTALTASMNNYSWYYQCNQ